MTFSTWIPRGPAGTWITVQAMRVLVAQALADPLLVDSARAIVRTAPTGDAPAEAAQIRRFLSEAVRFVRDPVGVETLTSPGRMLREIATSGTASGDCDEIATLGAAVGIAVGFPARFTLFSFTPDGDWRHVFAEIHDGRGWVELDTSREAQGIPPDFQPAGFKHVNLTR